MSRFTDYQEVLAQGGVRLDWLIELLSPRGEAVLATTDPDRGSAMEWGAELAPVNYASDRVAQRTGRLVVPITDPALVPTQAGDLLDPDTRNMVRVSLGFERTDGGWTWRPLSSFLVSTVDTESIGNGAATATVALVDGIRPVNSETVHSHTVADGTPCEVVAARILGEVLAGDMFQLEETGFTMPAATIAPGTNRLEVVSQILEGCGHELLANPNGLVISQAIPPTAIDSGERWRYGVGGIPVARARRISSIRARQGHKVVGGSLQQSEPAVSVIVWDQDPTSQGFFAGEGESTIRESRFPFVQSVPQATAAGYGQLRRHGAGPVQAEFWTATNPAMMSGDLVHLVYPSLKLDHVCRVVAFDMPVHLSSGLMRVVVRGVWDPATAERPPLDRQPGYSSGFADDFQRANQNLEDTSSESGSVEWIERGYSWGVVDGNAIQRYDRGWSMALHNRVLGFADQWAEIDVVKVPSGRFLGPVVRSSGGFDGYAAVADSGGVVTLQIWLAGRAEQTIGTADTGGSVVGRTLRIESNGQALVVKVDGAVIIEATDDRRTGGHVGMLGYGGPAANAPTVGAFRSGEVL